ncbi:thermonuclease family protein [Breoghania sp. JC706]|uniref:thermonuclease family protein n=1 Tax=Breoghania sp. JC706 TaxID=3117732 RepID=UPI00300A7733
MFQFVRLAAVIGIVFFACLSFWPALDAEHSGPVNVIDADTIEVGGEKHRFYGIDAVEIDQRCRRCDSAEWPCGREAAAALTKFLEGRKVNCEVWQGTTRDAHGRFVSVCYADADDINSWVAKNGWAVVDREANRLYNYTSDEGSARFLRRGIWDGTFDPSAEWRRQQQVGRRP